MESDKLSAEEADPVGGDLESESIEDIIEGVKRRGGVPYDLSIKDDGEQLRSFMAALQKPDSQTVSGSSDTERPADTGTAGGQGDNLAASGVSDGDGTQGTDERNVDSEQGFNRALKYGQPFDLAYSSDPEDLKRFLEAVGK
ncbi:hypothetical protein CVT24_012291 [Panaeolus cyanescens]|uniref:Uncharacterized protein n=1 Tax=Panaeolus cyanescens TaxID=181874 RepID=A0A409YJ66_9AGAR|nr:hypothetical protein CVT24_012291 [Panaeolus cyanescens]